MSGSRLASRLAGALFGCALAFAINCTHDAAPAVAPDEHPPLPESTPIGYLLDDAGELHLRDEQLGKLREIDGALSQQLDALEADQHGSAPVARQAAAGGGRRGGGRRGGGRRGGGGGASAGSPSSPAAIANAGPTTFPADGSAAGSAAPPSPPVQPAKTEDRASDIKAAVARAFAVLDPDQQPAARKLLADHGIDVQAAASSGSGEP